MNKHTKISLIRPRTALIMGTLTSGVALLTGIAYSPEVSNLIMESFHVCQNVASIISTIAIQVPAFAPVVSAGIYASKHNYHPE